MASCGIPSEDFAQFCQEQKLKPPTIGILLKHGFEDVSCLEDLTDDAIDEILKPELLPQQVLRLKKVVRKLHQDADQLQSPTCATSPVSGSMHLIERRFEHLGEHKEIRIVLLGKTGVGKSSTANTIYGSEDAFPSQAGVESHTVCCMRKSVSIDGQRITIIDTPGVYETDRDQEEVNREVTRAMTFCSPGPHCFLMVVKANARFSREEYSAFLLMKQMFGEAVTRHMIILFTGADEIKGDFSKVLERRAQQNLGKMLSDANRRYILFNNMSDWATKDRQVLDLLKMINDIMAAHQPPYFRSDQTEKVEKELEEEARRVAEKKLITEDEARKEILEKLDKEEEPGFLKRTAAAVGVAALVAGAVGLTVMTGGAGLAAVALAGEAGAGTAAALAAGTSAVSALGAHSAAEKAKDLGGKYCSLM